MIFAHCLARLRDAADTRAQGIDRDKVLVNRADLRELLHHFDRLDAEARARNTGRDAP